MTTQNIGQKIKEELIGRRDELTRLDSQDYSNQQFDQLIIRNSISPFVFYIVLAIILIVLLLLPDKEGELNLVQLFKSNWFWASLISLLPVTTLFTGIRGLINRTPQLIVDTKGIKAKDWELGWSEIMETKFRFFKGKTILLIITTKTEEKIFDLRDKNIGHRFLGHHIELLKKRFV